LFTKQHLAEKTGKIENVFPDNGVSKAELLFKDNSKLVVKTNDPNLQTLFMKNSTTNNKIYTLFSYEEMKEYDFPLPGFPKIIEARSGAIRLI